MMQSSIGRSDWFDWTSKCHIFFSTENNPNNVHIEKKLRLWRFWKFKNFYHFSAFLHPKRYLKVYMVFCKIDPLTLIILDFPGPCELIVPFLIFLSPNHKEHIFMVFSGFWRFFVVFWAKSWRTHKLKFSKNFQNSIFLKWA